MLLNFRAYIVVNLRVWSALRGMRIAIFSGLNRADPIFQHDFAEIAHRQHTETVLSNRLTHNIIYTQSSKARQFQPILDREKIKIKKFIYYITRLPLFFGHMTPMISPEIPPARRLQFGRTPLPDIFNKKGVRGD